MGKAEPWKDKPKPPKKEEILKDLAKAPSTDVVFKVSLKDHNFNKDDPSDVANSNMGKSTASSKSVSVDKEDLDNTYDKVTKLIKMHEKLNEEPIILNKKYELLQKLGEEVSKSISQLKSAAETVGNKDYKASEK